MRGWAGSWTHVSVVDDVGELDAVTSAGRCVDDILSDEDGAVVVVLDGDDGEGRGQDGDVLLIAMKEKARSVWEKVEGVESHTSLATLENEN